MGMGWDVEQRKCACQYHSTFSTCSVFLLRGNNRNQNLHSPSVGLHVDTTAHFSSFLLYVLILVVLIVHIIQY